MRLTPRIQKAINWAAIKHRRHARKENLELPYITHLFSVAWILSNYTDDEEVIIAGIIHDVLEDVLWQTEEEISTLFGVRVLEMVKESTEDKELKMVSCKSVTWEERKRRQLAKLQNASYGNLLIAAADNIHNWQSTIDTFEIIGNNIWKYFNASKERKLWLFGEVAKVLNARLKNDIMVDFNLVYEATINLFKDRDRELPDVQEPNEWKNFCIIFICASNPITSREEWQRFLKMWRPSVKKLLKFRIKEYDDLKRPVFFDGLASGYSITLNEWAKQNGMELN